MELDNALRSSCSLLKLNAVRFLLAPLVSLITKAEALVGDLPVSSAATKKPLKLKTQPVATQPDPSLASDPAGHDPAVGGSGNTLRVVAVEEDEVQLPAEDRNRLNALPFAKPDRIREAIEV